MPFPDGTADFRSDTVTRPTDEMRRAMAAAPVGDDVYGEDPSVNSLEEDVAATLGKEAAVFVPSGTMGNQIAINVLTRPGTEIVCVETAHVRNYEYGAAAVLSGASFRPLAAADGVMAPEQIDQVLVASRHHLPEVAVLAWENTHTASGGSVVPLDAIEVGSDVARRHGLSVHLDGAHLWNAAVATGISPARFAAEADTVMTCFSKGLGAPVGSVLAAPAAIVDEARGVRGRLGGAMRQAGVMAAAARIALRDRDRLVEDHEVAAQLADGLADRFPQATDPDAAVTNMVLLRESGLPFTTETLRSHLAGRGILVGYIAPGVLRFCTHRDVDVDDVRRVMEAVDVLAAL